MSQQRPRNAADERALNRQKEQERLGAEQEIADLQWLMSTERGRRIMWSLLSRAGVFRISMTGNSWTFFNEGRRSLGNELMAAVNDHCAEQYPLMVAEAQARIRKSEEVSNG